MGDGDGIVRMDVAEFREAGFLQEANRLFFHPHGLALEVVVEDDGSERLGGIWDYRDDPEGVVFGPGVIDAGKVERVREQRERHCGVRARMFHKPGVTIVVGDDTGIQRADPWETGPAGLAAVEDSGS